MKRLIFLFPLLCILVIPNACENNFKKNSSQLDEPNKSLLSVKDLLNTSWVDSNLHLSFFNDSEIVITFNNAYKPDYFKYKIQGDSIKGDSYSRGTIYKISFAHKDTYTLEGIISSGGWSYTVSLSDKNKIDPYNYTANKQEAVHHDTTLYSKIITTLKRDLNYPEGAYFKDYPLYKVEKNCIAKCR